MQTVVHTDPAFKGRKMNSDGDNSAGAAERQDRPRRPGGFVAETG
jgi:hypothetical protein